MAFLQNFVSKDVDTVEELIGFKLPITFDSFNQSVTTLESTRANLRCLLQTERGERVLQPQLGLNLIKHLFEPLSDESYVSIEEDVIEQIAIWLPFLMVIGVVIEEETENNLLKIKVSYSFKNTNNLTDSVQLDLSTGASY